jgi:hypothetical protein
MLWSSRWEAEVCGAEGEAKATVVLAAAGSNGPKEATQALHGKSLSPPV